MPTDGTGNVKVERRLAAILAADIAGYSALMGTDEARTVRDLKGHQSVLLPMIASFSGRVIDTAGDGILAEFGSVVNAVTCAVAIQKTMVERNASVDIARRMQFRIGINLGDVVYDEARIYGDDINIAARLESIAEPGGICVSGKVHDEIVGKIGITCHDLGPQQLKNIARPVQVYRVQELVSAKPIALSPHEKPPLPLPDRPSIAVLPFSNLSNDPEQEYFVDGIVDEIITALSHFRWLFVIARNSSFTYKGRAVDVKQVSRELGVRYVLEGSVRKAANRVRIVAQLVDATTRVHISSARFDGELKDIFDLQEQVAASVAGAAAPKLEENEIERARRKPTDNLDAYDYFLRAMPSIYQPTKEANDEALRLLNKAIELDPYFASAYGQATWFYCLRKARGWSVAPEQDIAETARLARRAVELGKDDAFALCWAGFSLAYVVGELDDGAAFMDRALALNTNLALAWSHSGWVRIWLGEPEIAIEHLARAMRLSPLDLALPVMQYGTAAAHFFAGRYDEASSWAEKSIREQPNNPEALAILSSSCALAGQVEKAESAMARLRQIAPERRLSNLKDRMPPFRRPEYFAKFMEGARKAGLPE